MTPDELDDAIFTGVVADVIGSSMATFVVCENKLPEWRDWLRAKILARTDASEGEVLKMYQVMANAPDDIIEEAIHMFVAKHQVQAAIASTISKGFRNG